MDQEFEVEIVPDDDNGYTQVDTEASTENDQQIQQPPAEDGKADDQEGGEDPRQARKKRKQQAKERIDELTRKWRDEQRQRQEVEDKLQRTTQEQEQFYNSVRTQQVESAKVVFNTLTRNKKLLERNLRAARNSGDTKAELELQDEIDNTRYQLQQIRQYYPDVEAPAQQGSDQQQQQPTRTQTAPQQQAPQRPQQQPTQQGQQPAVPEAAKSWIEANQVLKTRTELHPLINSLDQTLKQEGKDPTSPEFYAELNKRLKTVVAKEIGDQLKDATDGDVDLSFLDDDDDADEDEGTNADGKSGDQVAQQQTERPTVSSGQRSTPANGVKAGRQKVKLSRDQVAIAHRMGLSPEQYAAQLTKQTDPNGYTQI